MKVLGEAQADLLLGLPDRGVDEALVVTLRAAPGQADVAGPRIVRVVGPLDEEGLESAPGRAQDQGPRPRARCLR